MNMWCLVVQTVDYYRAYFYVAAFYHLQFGLR